MDGGIKKPAVQTLVVVLVTDEDGVEGEGEEKKRGTTYFQSSSLF